MFKVLILGAAHKHIFSIAQRARACRGAKLIGVYDDQPELAQAAGERLGMCPIATLQEALATGPR